MSLFLKTYSKLIELSKYYTSIPSKTGNYFHLINIIQNIIQRYIHCNLITLVNRLKKMRNDGTF